VKWYSAAAAAGNPGAAYGLGLCHLNGTGVPKSARRGRAFTFSLAISETV
jgi:TPR repeat protein